MGHCSSKSTTSEVHQHKMIVNTKNDHYFTFIPSLAYDANISRLPPNSLSELTSRLKESKDLFSKKYSQSGMISNSIPEIHVEIQKGVVMLKSAPHKNNQLYVRVSLEPEGPFCDTLKSDPFLPDWNYMIMFQQRLENFSSIKFRVLFENSKQEDNVLGSFSINLTVLNSQEAFKKWHNLVIPNKSPADQAEILVRIQLVHDEKELYQMMSKMCQDKIEEIEKIVGQKQSLNSSRL